MILPRKHTPIATSDRIVSLDIIRGFALFGILLVNMPLFQTPKLIEDLYMITPSMSSTDSFLRMLLDVFVEAKFFTIFSFLFGISFYIFMKRAEEKQDNFYLLYSRRLIGLALFGLLHLVFLWYGDILLQYALSGFLLIYFYNKENKTILKWLGVFTFALLALLSISILGSASSVKQPNTSLQEIGSRKVQEAIDVYQNGSYVEWISYRFFNEVIPVLMNLPFQLITSLFMFLIGLYVAKRGIFNNIPLHKPFIKCVCVISFIVSIPISIAIIILHLKIVDFGVLNNEMIQSLIMISGLSLSFFYVSTLVLLLEKEKWRRLLSSLSYVGRMALTNYILQTIIGVGVFTGLGMFGTLNIGLGIIISIIIFPLQILFSYLWLKRFRFGPLEWVWRSITYGKMQPLKIVK